MKRWIGWLSFMLLLFLVAARPASPQTSHSIKVSWTYTQGVDLATGFNVYRAPVSTGPYTKQNAAPLPLATLTYTDTTCAPGATCWYAITGIDTLGDESIQGGPASATMLQNPLAPQGVTAIAQ